MKWTPSEVQGYGYPTTAEDLERLYADLPIGVCRASVDEQRILDANQALAEMLGYEHVGDLVGKRMADHFPDPALCARIAEELRTAGSVRKREIRMYATDGTEVRGALTVQLRRLSSGHEVIEGVVEDVTERRRMEEELAEIRHLHEEAQQIAGLGHWVSYPEQAHTRGRIWWSPNLYRLFGRDPEGFEPTVEAFFEHVHPEDREAVYLALRNAEHSGRYRVEHRVLTAGGEVRWLREVGRVEYHQDGSVHRVVGTAQDITEQRLLQHELERRASHDALTGLPNRSKLQDHLRIAQASFERYRTPFAVILFDIDHFKRVNDRHGHGFGDRVLQEVAERVRGQLRDSDLLGRWGGEEFLILALHTEAAGAVELAQRVRAAVAQLSIECVGATASFGVAAFEPGLTLAQIEERADRAMYAAKRAGRNRVERYAGKQTTFAS